MLVQPLDQQSCLSRFNGYVKLSETVAHVLWQVTHCAAKAFDFLAKAFTSLSSMPVLKSFMEACGKQVYAISVVLNGMNKGCELKKNAGELQRNQQKLDRWSKSNEVLNEINGNSSITVQGWQQAEQSKGCVLTDRQNKKQGILIQACQGVASAGSATPAKSALKAFVNIKIEKLQVKLHNLKVERVKHRLSIAYDIGYTAGAIGALAASAGIVMVGASPLPLLFIAFLTASIGLGKETYGAFHKDAKKIPQLSYLEKDIVNQYSLLKHRELKA